MRKTVLLFLLAMTNIGLMAQVAINTDNSAPDASAMLDVKSTTSGLLIPRMTAVDRDNIASPATGLTVYVTDDNSFYYFDGTNWVRLQESGKSWLLAGNAGTSGTEFLGTTDAQPLIFKTNNVERMQINTNGAVGVNVAPIDFFQFYTEANDKDYVGIFNSTRTNSDDYGVVGVVANTDYYGIGGGFQGGYYGVQGIVLPLGNNDYYGVQGYVSGGAGSNYGLESYVKGDGTNVGNLNSVYDGGSGNATNFGTLNSLTDGTTNYGSYANITGNGTNYGFYASLSGTGTNYGYYGAFDVNQGNGSVAYFDNRNDTGVALIANGNNLSSYYLPVDAGNNPLGAGIIANGSNLGIISYTDLNDNAAVAIEGSYAGTTNTNATGVVGYSMPAASYGYGVKGFGGLIGVYGYTDANGLAGVYGYAPTNNDAFSAPYAVFADGDLGSSGAKNFLIDHPLDPENKYLKHFSIESNEILNVYRGNVVLNANGEAIIKLPGYFKAVNKNFSYMLTPVGQPAPGIYVAKEINNEGEFKISGGHAGQKISWYVYAQRNDPYIQQHPEKLQVEVFKKEKNRGKFLMPELYNQPAEKRIGYSNSNHSNAVKVKNKPEKVNIKNITKKPKKKLNLKKLLNNK